MPAHHALRPQSVQRISVGAQTFADPTGDGGIGPDVSTVSVSNDDAGGLTFQITTPNRPLLNGQDVVFMPLDTDLNASTGERRLRLSVRRDSRQLGAAELAARRTLLLRHRTHLTHRRLDLHARDRRRHDSLVYRRLNNHHDEHNDHHDPNDTTTTTPPPPPPLTLSVAKFVVGSAKSGKAFDVLLIVFREDTGDPLGSGKVTCAARVGTKPLRLSAKGGPKVGLALCEWKLAKTAKGKRVTGTMKVTFQVVSVTRAFAKKIS